MALIDETEAADISSKAKKINQEFWTKEIDKARKTLIGIDMEIRLSPTINDERRELYKCELNLIGRDWVYSNITGLNVNDIRDKLTELRKRLY